MSMPIRNAYVVWDYWNHQMQGPYRSFQLADRALRALRARAPYARARPRARNDGPASRRSYCR